MKREKHLCRICDKIIINRKSHAKYCLECEMIATEVRLKYHRNKKVIIDEAYIKRALDGSVRECKK